MADKHSSLFGLLVSHKEKKFCILGPGQSIPPDLAPPDDYRTGSDAHPGELHFDYDNTYKDFTFNDFTVN
jgi:hypothetical protein